MLNQPVGKYSKELNAILAIQKRDRGIWLQKEVKSLKRGQIHYVTNMSPRAYLIKYAIIQEGTSDML